MFYKQTGRKKTTVSEEQVDADLCKFGSYVTIVSKLAKQFRFF